MKKMISVKSMYSVVAAICLFGSSLSATPIPTPKAIHVIETAASFIGEWNYTVDNAPVEYSKGVLKVVKNNGNLKVTVNVNYSSHKGEQVKLKGDKLDFVIYIDGQRVDVSLTVNGNKFNGKAESPEGVFPMKGTRSSLIE